MKTFSKEKIHLSFFGGRIKGKHAENIIKKKSIEKATDELLVQL